MDDHSTSDLGLPLLTFYCFKSVKPRPDFSFALALEIKILPTSNKPFLFEIFLLVMPRMHLLARAGIAAAILSNVTVAYKVLPTTDAAGVRTYDLDARKFELQGPYSKPDIHDAGFDVAAELLKVLPAHQPINISRWEAGVLPSNCLKYFGSDGRQVTRGDFTVYNVGFYWWSLPRNENCFTLT